MMTSTIGRLLRDRDLFFKVMDGHLRSFSFLDDTSNIQGIFCQVYRLIHPNIISDLDLFLSSQLAMSPQKK